ncbi:GtrA family protein [Patescibacteria group bacterium]|nr:GtrA family protein [Patescibacteria group bacterium]
MLILKFYKNQLFRYVFVAGTNVIVGYGIFALLIFLKLHYILAITVATIFGILFGFKTLGVLVFNNKNNLLIFKYLIVWVIVYLLNIAGLTVLNYLKINNYIAGLIILIPLAGLGFLLNNKFVFKKTDQDKI